MFGDAELCCDCLLDSPPAQLRAEKAELHTNLQQRAAQALSCGLETRGAG